MGQGKHLKHLKGDFIIYRKSYYKTMFDFKV